MDIFIKSQFAWIIKWRRHGVERRARPLTTRWERQRSAEDLGAIVAPIPNECSAMAFLDEFKNALFTTGCTTIMFGWRGLETPYSTGMLQWPASGV
ncbi:unnamed protein product [Urochloa humidicola]